ncbi:MAG TPA: tripartite tricarboxylate transporter substrate binding protein [Burkholderiales bacterium]|nr:tripartite tricarboxylate transporter substrate binding protein [Burkholderiales bacterium]
MRVMLALLLCLLPPAVIAQGFPSKPLRLVLRSPPGGTDDLLGRLIAQKMPDFLGQQVVVDYRTGAGGLVAWQYVTQAPPDGYTMLLAASGLGAIRTLRPDATIDPWRDFAWLSQVVNYQLIVLVHPSLPAQNLKQLIAMAKAKPGQLSYGSSGIGATPHLAGEYLKAMAKIDITHVPYKGAGPMYIDLLGGRLEMGMAVVGSAVPHIKAKRLRALGVSGSKRVAQIPDVPTIAEAGVSGYELDAYYALLAPGKTPRDIVNRLADATAKVVASPEYRTRVIESGMEPVANTPEQMLQVARKDGEKIEKIVRTANIHVGAQ